MLETVRIRQSGYSIKYTFQVTVDQHPRTLRRKCDFEVEGHALPSCGVLVAGLRAPLSRADASWHDSDQVRHQGVFQTEPPAARRLSSGQHHGTNFPPIPLLMPPHPRLLPSSSFHLCLCTHRCSCGRRSASASRPSFIRRSCGVSWCCSAASEPSWRGSTLWA